MHAWPLCSTPVPYSSSGLYLSFRKAEKASSCRKMRHKVRFTRLPSASGAVGFLPGSKHTCNIKKQIKRCVQAIRLQNGAAWHMARFQQGSHSAAPWLRVSSCGSRDIRAVCTAWTSAAGRAQFCQPPLCHASAGQQALSASASLLPQPTCNRKGEWRMAISIRQFKSSEEIIPSKETQTGSHAASLLLND